MLLSGILDYSGSVTPLVLLIIALVINIYTGKLTLFSKHKGHPVNSLKRLIDWFDLKLNRDNRSPIDRAIRGCLTTISIFLLSGIFGLGVTWLSHSLPLAWIFELVLLLITLDQSNTYKKVSKINTALSNHDIETARQRVIGLTLESVDQMDAFSIARTAIEVLATSLVKHLLAPVFYYALFGFLGLAIYHAITTLNIKIGQKTNRYRYFGMTASCINTTILFFPGLLAGCLIVLASLLVPSANPVKSYKNIFKYGNKFYSSHLGIALSAFAGAFDLALAGPRKFSHKRKNEPWIGAGTAKATHQDIHRSLHLYATVCLINSLIITALILMQYL
jgi:adenosylcobinamide-phosphate synthase